ncbi:uncharacterized protein [Branchiostoma lanceolatum]|uniref:uncharacterized protein n=1 Tax=Branchiostoma lanceolatum TaxID=7740 RepID=UPI0034545A76
MWFQVQHGGLPSNGMNKRGSRTTRRRRKVESLPDIRTSFGAQDMDDTTDPAWGTGVKTPYRLPRLHLGVAKNEGELPRGNPPVHPEGYYTRSTRTPPPLEISTSSIMLPAQSLAQLARQRRLGVPKFRAAMVRPRYTAIPHTPPQSVNMDHDDLSVSTTAFPSLFRKTPHSLQRDLLPTPSPRSRLGGSSPDWKLSSYPPNVYDSKDQGYTGPYSREFVVHCMAPNNWLRMKLRKHVRTTPAR